MNSEFSLDFFISAMNKSRQTEPNAHLTHRVISFQCIIKEKTKIVRISMDEVLPFSTLIPRRETPRKHTVLEARRSNVTGILRDMTLI